MSDLKQRILRLVVGGATVVAMIVAAASPSSAATGDITTVAGGGTQGYSLADVTGVAVYGNTLYAADWRNVVFARDLTTNHQTYVAGRYDQMGHTGDGGPASSATLERPWKLAVDPQGNLFVDEMDGSGGSCYLRRIDHATHVITTYAGDGSCTPPADETPVAATAAGIGVLSAMAVNASGDIFIADGSSRIRKISHIGPAHMITTVAGVNADGYVDDTDPATARFHNVDGLAFDPSGNLFVADVNNNAIRKISSDWSTVSTVVGGSLNPTRGHVDDVAADAQIDLKSIAAVAVSPTGDVYFGDGQWDYGLDPSARVSYLRKFDGTNVTTVAGRGTAGDGGDGGPASGADLQQPRQLAFDGAGNLYVGVQNVGQDNQLRQITAGDQNIHDITRAQQIDIGDGGQAIDAFFSRPIDLLRIGTTLYVAELEGNRVRAVNLRTGVVTTFAGTGVQGNAGDGGPATQAELNTPDALATDGTYLYILGSGAIRRVNLSTRVITSLGTPGVCWDPTVDPGTYDPSFPGCGDGQDVSHAKFSHIMGMVATKDGRLYLADTFLSAIRCIGCDGPGIVSTVVGKPDRSFTAEPNDGDPAQEGTGAIMPLRVITAPDGGVVYSEGTGAVYEITPPSDPHPNTIRRIAGVPQDILHQSMTQDGDNASALDAHIGFPLSLRYSASGHLYIGEAGTNPWFNTGAFHPKIRCLGCNAAHPDWLVPYAGNGTFNADGGSGDGGPALAAEFSLPTAMAPDSGTHTFVADLLNNRIRRIEGPKPDLRVALSADGPLTAGEAGVVHVAVTNGAAADSEAYLTGPVSASVTLPAGLSFASASVVSPAGLRRPQDAVASWSCDGSGQSVSCTTPDNLVPQASSTFDITVNVAADAPESVTVNANGSSDSDVADPGAQIAVLGITIRRSARNESDGGYVLAGADGGTFAFGPAGFPGAVAVPGNRVVGGAPAGAHGSWLVAADGSVFTTGDAQFFGSLGGRRLNSPIVGMAASPSGGGYWLVAADGGVFAFGSAAFHGSLGAMTLNSPIVGMAASPSGGGYWLVAADGGVFAEGDAGFFGSLGATALQSPVVGMAATPSGKGYWLVASDGGVFAYGDATFAGSHGGSVLNSPIVALVPTTAGAGYRLVARDGGVFAYGTAVFDGSLAATRLNAPIVAAW